MREHLHFVVMVQVLLEELLVLPQASPCSPSCFRHQGTSSQRGTAAYAQQQSRIHPSLETITHVQAGQTAQKPSENHS